MTNRLGLAVTLAATLLTGCATPPPVTRVVLDPIGPRIAGPSRSRDGFLRVHSATTDEQSGRIPYQVHSPYWVYTGAGEKVRAVANHVGITDQRPMTTPLPPGQYRVLARADAHGLVTVPVVVQGGMLTEVFLERTGMEVPPGVVDADLVRLPDGTVAGYRAKAARPAPKPAAP
jgi:hypothetical protein